MYLKILTKRDTDGEERTIIFPDIKEAMYLACALSKKAFKEFTKGSNQVWVTGTEPKGDEKRTVGTLDIVERDGKHKFVMFDRVAFLCNEQGKAVERFLVR